MLYIVLLHYPVYNKEGKIVTTAIANMDIHDIARVCQNIRSARILYSKSYIGSAQLAQEIISHWREGYGANFNKFAARSF